MNTFTIDDFEDYDEIKRRIDYDEMKASMLSKIKENISRGNDCMHQPMIHLIIKIEPTRKISLDEYRIRQQLKLVNQPIDESLLKPSSPTLIEVQYAHQLITPTYDEYKKDRNRIKCKRYRDRQRMMNVKPERAKPLTDSERSKRYRERKKIDKNLI